MYSSSEPPLGPMSFANASACSLVPIIFPSKAINSLGSVPKPTIGIRLPSFSPTRIKWPKWPRCTREHSSPSWRRAHRAGSPRWHMGPPGSCVGSNPLPAPCSHPFRDGHAGRTNTAGHWRGPTPIRHPQTGVRSTTCTEGNTTDARPLAHTTPGGALRRPGLSANQPPRCARRQRCGLRWPSPRSRSGPRGRSGARLDGHLRRRSDDPARQGRHAHRRLRPPIPRQERQVTHDHDQSCQVDFPALDLFAGRLRAHALRHGRE